MGDFFIRRHRRRGWPLFSDKKKRVSFFKTIAGAWHQIRAYLTEPQRLFCPPFLPDVSLSCVSFIARLAFLLAVKNPFFGAPEKMTFCHRSYGLDFFAATWSSSRMFLWQKILQFSQRCSICFRSRFLKDTDTDMSTFKKSAMSELAVY